MLTFVNVDVEVAGELWQFVGCRPTARLAGLAAEVARRGHVVTLHFGSEVTTGDIARAIARAGPNLVVLEEDEQVRTVVAAVAAGLDAPWVVVSDADPARHPGDPEGLLAELARRGLTPTGPPRDGSGPYELGLVPVRLASDVGIECSYRDPAGVACRHPAESVVRELHAVDTVVNDGAPVLLHGAITGAEGDTTSWWQVLAGEFRPRYVRPAVRGPLEALDETASEQLRLAGIREVVAETRTSGWTPGDVEARLRQLAAAGLSTTLYLAIGEAWTDAGVRQVGAAVRGLVAACERLGIPLTWTVPRDAAPALVREVEAAAPATTSPTTAQRSLFGGPGRLVRALAGRYPRVPAAAPLDAVVVAPDALCDDPQLLGLGWGLNTTVLHDSDPPPVPGLPRLAVHGLDAELQGQLVVNGEHEVEVLPYATGREVTPLGPLALRLASPADVEAFVADADRAVQEGQLLPNLLEPMVHLADQCAFAGPGACASPRLARMFVDGGGVRAAPRAPVLGSPDRPVRELRRAAQALEGEAQRRRGCATCPVARLCSKDLCLSGLLGDAEYCGIRTQRPWLAGYVHTLRALRRLVGTSAQPPELRVSGLGGPLLYPEAAHLEPDRAALVRAGEEFCLVGEAPRRSAKLQPDAAFIAEGLLSDAGVAAVAATLAEQRGVSRASATEAVAGVARNLEGRGLLTPPAAP